MLQIKVNSNSEACVAKGSSFNHETISSGDWQHSSASLGSMHYFLMTANTDIQKITGPVSNAAIACRLSTLMASVAMEDSLKGMDGNPGDGATG